MDLDITKEERERLEKFLKEHPIEDDQDEDFLIIDDRFDDVEAMKKRGDQALASMIKALLDGKIK